MREKRSRWQVALGITGAVSVIASIIEFPSNTGVILAAIDHGLVFANTICGRLLFALIGLGLIATVAAPPSVWRRCWQLSRCGDLVKCVCPYEGLKSEGWSGKEKNFGGKQIDFKMTEGSPSAGCVIKSQTDFVLEYRPPIALNASLVLFTGLLPTPDRRLDAGLLGIPPSGISPSLILRGNDGREVVAMLVRSSADDEPQLAYGEVWRVSLKPLARADGLEEWLVSIPNLSRRIFGASYGTTLTAVRFEGNYMSLRSLEFLRTAGLARRIRSAVDLLIHRGERN